MTLRVAPGIAELIELAYELLDAHDDTAALIGADGGEARLPWATHLDYLRALQRQGREILARASSES